MNAEPRQYSNPGGLIIHENIELTIQVFVHTNCGTRFGRLSLVNFHWVNQCLETNH